MRTVRVSAVQEEDGTWRARCEDPRFALDAPDADACLAKIHDRVKRRSGEEAPVIMVEALPWLLGVAEAAKLLGWDKRRVITYIRRNSFPEPLQSLAGGRVWALDDVRSFRDQFRSRHRRG